MTWFLQCNELVGQGKTVAEVNDEKKAERMLEQSYLFFRKNRKPQSPNRGAAILFCSFCVSLRAAEPSYYYIRKEVFITMGIQIYADDTLGCLSTRLPSCQTYFNTSEAIASVAVGMRCHSAQHHARWVHAKWEVFSTACMRCKSWSHLCQFLLVAWCSCRVGKM